MKKLQAKCPDEFFGVGSRLYLAHAPHGILAYAELAPQRRSSVAPSLCGCAYLCCSLWEGAGAGAAMGWGGIETWFLVIWLPVVFLTLPLCLTSPAAPVP